MNCPKCKTKKGRPVRVDPVAQRCPKCKASIFQARSGKRIVRGVSVRAEAKPATPAPAPAAEK